MAGAFGVMAVTATSAQAVTAEHAEAIGQWAYRNAPFAEQSCAATCAELLERQYALPSYSRPAGELAGLEARAGLWTRALPVLSRVTLAGTAAYLGWKIGSGIRDLWVQAPSPTTVEAPSAGGARLYPEGQTMVAFWGQDVPAPVSGWLLDYGGLPYFYTIRAVSPCPAYPSYPTVPADGMLLTRDLPQPAGDNCGTQACPLCPPVWHPNTPEQQGAMFVPLKTSTPVPYTGQSTNGTVSAGTDPGLASATSNVTTELNTHTERYPTLLPWLEEQLDDIDFQHATDDYETNDGVDDVVKPDRDEYPWAAPPETDWRRWCEMSTPGAGMSAIDPEPDRFDSYDNPSFFPANTIGTADLLYGTNAEGGYGHWNDIKGFGVRKIAAKHGWTSADITATAAALLETPVGPLGAKRRYVYTGPSYSPPNPTVVDPAYAATGDCVRIVVVETVPRSGEPRSRAIITSFGKWTGDHPS
jgi:hypothetical protein